MPGNNHLVVFSHDPQLKWWSPAAKQVMKRLDGEAVAWVVGRHCQRLAEATGCYARVVDLVDGLDPDRAEADLQRNLDRVRRYEEEAGVQCFHEDVAVDRNVSHAGWRLPRIVHFAAHIMRAIDRQVQRHGDPVAAMGEANTLPYRLAYRMLRPRLFYFYPAVERSWPHRFSIEQSLTSVRPENQQLYEEYLETGMPEELERMAGERLQEFRAKALKPCYSEFGAHSRAWGTDPLYKKLQPRRAAGVASRWARRVLDGDLNDPRASHNANPGVKLVDTALEYARKQAFHDVARPPASDGLRYASYFMHVEPEYSVEGLAFEFRNQLAALQNIAAMLPGDMRLYVKEHRPMIGARPRYFFKALEVVPNIHLLTDDVNAHEIIRGSRIVFSLTGTSALEAMFYGVPAVILGSIYFQAFRGVYPVRSPGQLREVIHQVCADDGSGATDHQATAAMAALYASSYPGKICGAYPLEQMLENENMDLVVDGLVDALKAKGVS